MLEMAGLLTPKYVNQQYPWDGHADPKAPDIPDHGHVAVYRRNFAPSATIQAALRVGRRVTVTFHGAATAIYVWLNGAFIGYAEDSFTPSEFDVTAALREDGNILTVACYEFASASWLEDQDFWRLHGLFRSVEITAAPRSRWPTPTDPCCGAMITTSPPSSTPSTAPGSPTARSAPPRSASARRWPPYSPGAPRTPVCTR